MTAEVLTVAQGRRRRGKPLLQTAPFSIDDPHFNFSH